MRGKNKYHDNYLRFHFHFRDDGNLQDTEVVIVLDVEQSKRIHH